MVIDEIWLVIENILVNPEGNHDTEANGKLLEGDKGTSNLTFSLLAVFPHIFIIFLGKELRRTEEPLQSCRWAQSWTSFQHQYRCYHS